MKIRLLAGFLLFSWMPPISRAELPPPDRSSTLNQTESVPQNFTEAHALASNSLKAAQHIKETINRRTRENWPHPEIEQLTLDSRNELNDASQYFERAISLAGTGDDRSQVDKAYLFYAYVKFWQRKSYEAAVLAGYVSRTHEELDSTLALDAAYLAMASFVQAFTDNKSPVDQKGEDMKFIIQACNRIAERWPSSERANEAYMVLGRMYSTQKKPADAATWFSKVPSSDSKYPEAQINAGQAYWTAYLNSARLVGPEKKPPDQLSAGLNAAQDHLRRGIDGLSKTVPEDTASTELIAAKMSLVQIVISRGNDEEALNLLLDDPHSVIKAVTVADESTRPQMGITSFKFAAECYKLLLRAYLGTGNLDKARETIKKLDELIVAGGGIAKAVTIEELVAGINKQIAGEVQRLENIGDVDGAQKLRRNWAAWKRDFPDLAK